MGLQTRSVSIMRGISPELPEKLAAAGLLTAAGDDDFTVDPVTMATAAELHRIGVCLKTMSNLQLEVARTARQLARRLGEALPSQEPTFPHRVETLALLGQLCVSAFEAAMIHEVGRLPAAATAGGPPTRPPE